MTLDIPSFRSAGQSLEQMNPILYHRLMMQAFPNIEKSSVPLLCNN